MRTLLLAVALVLSLWPAAVVALAVERVIGGGDDGAQSAAQPTTTTRTTASTTTVPPKKQATKAAVTPAPEGAPAEPGVLDLAGLDRLRDDTATLVVAVSESTAASGQPDPQLAANALDVEAAVVTWQEANEGLGEDAEFFAALFVEIAAAAADYATAPSASTKQRLDEAVERHRRETLQEGP